MSHEADRDSLPGPSEDTAIETLDWEKGNPVYGEPVNPEIESEIELTHKQISDAISKAGEFGISPSGMIKTRLFAPSSLFK